MDGGTMVFTVSAYPKNREIHVDYRIGSTTKGSLWDGYPEKGTPLTEEEIEAFWRALDRYRECNQYTYDRCITLFKERGYKKPQTRIRKMDTICECGKGWWSMNSNVPNKVHCANCNRSFPEYIYIRH
jgi:hypothetical protein